MFCYAGALAKEMRNSRSLTTQFIYPASSIASEATVFGAARFSVSMITAKQLQLMFMKFSV